MRLWLNKFTNRIMGVYHKFPDTRYPVKYAFTVGGVDYYEFDDIFNLPYQRALKAMSAYEEIRMKCTFEYLKWHVVAIENNLVAARDVKGKVVINLLKIHELNSLLKQRLENWVIDLNHTYRLASIVYFDKSENPQEYDFKYANEKIAHWKKHETMDVFFSKVPIQKLIPFIKGFDMNFQIYSEVIKQMETADLAKISENLSDKQRKMFTEWQSLSSVETIIQN